MKLHQILVLASLGFLMTAALYDVNKDVAPPVEVSPEIMFVRNHLRVAEESVKRMEARGLSMGVVNDLIARPGENPSVADAQAFALRTLRVELWSRAAKNVDGPIDFLLTEIEIRRLADEHLAKCVAAK